MASLPLPAVISWASGAELSAGRFQNPINPGPDPWMELGMLIAGETAEPLDPKSWSQ
jgi:hypothetical protein